MIDHNVPTSHGIEAGAKLFIHGRRFDSVVIKFYFETKLLFNQWFQTRNFLIHDWVVYPLSKQT